MEQPNGLPEPCQSPGQSFGRLDLRMRTRRREQPSGSRPQRCCCPRLQNPVLARGWGSRRCASGDDIPNMQSFPSCLLHPGYHFRHTSPRLSMGNYVKTRSLRITCCRHAQPWSCHRCPLRIALFRADRPSAHYEHVLLISSRHARREPGQLIQTTTSNFAKLPKRHRLPGTPPPRRPTAFRHDRRSTGATSKTAACSTMTATTAPYIRRMRLPAQGLPDPGCTAPGTDHPNSSNWTTPTTSRPPRADVTVRKPPVLTQLDPNNTAAPSGQRRCKPSIRTILIQPTRSSSSSSAKPDHAWSDKHPAYRS